MKILVVGFMKTGTKSLNAALRTLGYSVYDYDDTFYHLRKQWIKILRKGGTRDDFYEMYKNVDASVDIPAAYFWEEILEAFPDCKLIFMRRKSEEEWLVSFSRQVKAIGDSYTMSLLTFVSPTANGIISFSHLVGRIVFGNPPQRFWRPAQTFSETVAKKRYRDHNTSVLEGAPKNQLLEFDLSQGWEPLCKFLEKPIPKMDFPYKNKNATILDEMIRESPVFQQMKKEMFMIVSIIAVVLSILVFYWFFE